MTERNEYVDALKSEFDAYSDKVTEIIDAYEESIDPGPEPIVPRPVLPADFKVQGRGRTVALSWSMPLPRETPGVQVQRRAEDPEISSWKSLTKEAVDRWSDIISEDYADVESVWIYRIRGYGYKADGTPHASPWSEEIAYEIQIDPPVPPPGPTDFKAIDRAEKTAAENKVWRVPSMLASRTGRTPIGAIGDVRRGDWTEGDLVKENLASTNPPRPSGQWNSNLHQDWIKRPGTYTWSNIEATGAIKDIGQTNLLWGSREYNCPQRFLLDCDFSYQKEHGVYLSPYEGATAKNCTFVNIGAQGLQHAHRPGPNSQYGPDNFPYEKKEEYTVDNCHMIDCGSYAGRGSFSLTYFTCGSVNFPSTIRVTNSSFVADWAKPNKDYFGDYHSTGAMVATAGDWPDGNVWTGGTQYELIHLENNLYDYTTPDRSILSLRSTDQIVIKDCVFLLRENSRGKNALLIDSYVDDPTIRSNHITLQNVWAPGCMGGVKNAGRFEMHCPDEEVKVDARTGTIISRRPL